MAKQKFVRGDVVRVADDLGDMMRHFKSGCKAIILYSYNDQYGGGNISSYGLLLLDDKGRPDYTCSWYEAQQLSLVKKATMREHRIIQKYNERRL